MARPSEKVWVTLPVQVHFLWRGHLRFIVGRQGAEMTVLDFHGINHY